MRLLRDFHCPTCGSDVERYIDSDTASVMCHCGSLAIRVVGMPRVALDGTDPGFPTAYDRWANTREQNRAVKTRRSYHGE